MSTITDIINYLQEYVSETDIKLYLGATRKLIYNTETANNIQLPDDIKLFYEFTDGFFSEEDQFRIAPLCELVWKEKDVQHMYIAEYMGYCDMWELIVNPKTNLPNYEY